MSLDPAALTSKHCAVQRVPWAKLREIMGPLEALGIHLDYSEILASGDSTPCAKPCEQGGAKFTARTFSCKDRMSQRMLTVGGGSDDVG